MAINFYISQNKRQLHKLITLNLKQMAQIDILNQAVSDLQASVADLKTRVGDAPTAAQLQSATDAITAVKADIDTIAPSA